MFYCEGKRVFNCLGISKLILCGCMLFIIETRAANFGSYADTLQMFGFRTKDSSYVSASSFAEFDSLLKAIGTDTATVVILNRIEFTTNMSAGTLKTATCGHFKTSHS